MGGPHEFATTRAERVRGVVLLVWNLKRVDRLARPPTDRNEAEAMACLAWLVDRFDGLDSLAVDPDDHEFLVARHYEFMTRDDYYQRVGRVLDRCVLLRPER
jgi:hypothetical protein